MKKLFISQPMRDKTNEEIEAERQSIIALVSQKFGEDVEVIDSFFKDAPHDAKPLWFLGKSFELLSNADIVVFAEGFDKARGCTFEFAASCQYLTDASLFVIRDGQLTEVDRSNCSRA